MIHYEIDTGLPLKLRQCWEILKDLLKFQEIAIPNSNTWSEGGSKRHKLSGSSSFNTESGEASINLNTTVGENDEDEDVLARLIVTEMTAHEKEERLVFLDIKRRDVECREREIEQQDMRWDGEVLIMGDFNEVRRKTERFGSVFNVQGADMFNTFIANAGLEEIPLGGSSFTWCHKSATKMSKLDRFLISENLFNSYPDICATSLDRFLSDHRPILLRESNHDYGPIPFRYFNHWTELDGFNKFVIDTWNSAPVETNAMRNVMQKFKFLKGKIREWLKIYKSKNGGSGILKEELNRIDADIDKGLASDIIINRRMEVIKSIQYLDKIHVMDLAQKAKVKWAIEGDENSRYFHGVLNKKRSQSNIRGIMVDGKWQDNPKVVKSEFFLHFRKRFEKPSANRILIDMNFPKTISIDQQTELEGAVSKEEVKKAVWDCGSDKSPGPDGFSFGFYRKFWTCIENDVFAAVNYFFTFGDIPKGCNACFIALIPKVHDANLVKDFRPISLIGSIYKIIAKILANRLVGVLGDIVNEVQSAFISDRQILDGPFILNEVIQWCKSKKKQSLIFKVDFEKAYDSVRWDFLDDVLKKFGFGNKWRDWIQKCLRSSRGSIIINGSPTEEFQFFKGLKQGDPLSPYKMGGKHVPCTSLDKIIDRKYRANGEKTRKMIREDVKYGRVKDLDTSQFQALNMLKVKEVMYIKKVDNISTLRKVEGWTYLCGVVDTPAIPQAQSPPLDVNVVYGGGNATDANVRVKPFVYLKVVAGRRVRSDVATGAQIRFQPVTISQHHPQFDFQGLAMDYGDVYFLPVYVKTQFGEKLEFQVQTNQGTVNDQDHNV
ncbi:RNA-directed DNA polymerase, eukaryota [Tanacetum coccineum]